MVHDTDIVELELKSKKFSLAVRKKEALEKAEPVYVRLPPPCCHRAAAESLQSQAQRLLPQLEPCVCAKG